MSTTVDGDSGGTAVTTTTLPTLQGQVLQVVNYQTGAVATGTTVTPADDTIPQITEGVQYMSLAVTPRSASSTLLVTVVSYAAVSVATAWSTTALFKDAATGAVAVGIGNSYTGGIIVPGIINYSQVSGSTASTTFTVRVGISTAGTLTFNGSSGGRVFGGVMSSSITITEVVP